MKIQITNSTTTMFYEVTNMVPQRPYLQISNSYLPLTTETLDGVKLKIQSGSISFRAKEYCTSGYTYLTTNKDVGNLSSTVTTTYTSTAYTKTGLGKTPSNTNKGECTLFRYNSSGVYSSLNTYSTTRAANSYSTNINNIRYMSWARIETSLYSNFIDNKTFSCNYLNSTTLAPIPYKTTLSGGKTSISYYKMSSTTSYTDGSTSSRSYSSISKSSLLTCSIKNSIKFSKNGDISSTINDNQISISSIPVGFTISSRTLNTTLTGKATVYFHMSTVSSDLTCYQGYSSSSNTTWR